MADGNDYMELPIEGPEMQVWQYVSPTSTLLATNTGATTDTGSWYTVHIQCDGTNVKVWRIQEGNPPSQVFDLTGVAITTTDRLNFQVGAGATFAIDDVRLVSDSLSKTTALAYNGGNELTTETSGAMTKTYTYDAYGRRSTKAQAAEGLQAVYTYAYADKLQAVTTNFPDEDATVEHLYDGLGKLRETVSPGGATWLRWDKGWNPVGMYPDASGVPGALNVGFVHHPQQDAAPPLSYRLFDTESSALFNFYGAYDNIGSLRRLRWDDDNASSLGAAEYAPYGEPYDQSMAISLYGYAGYFFDAGIGMSFAPYRWYDPEIARWMTRDPMGMIDGPNEYVYGRGNPTYSLDALGLATSYCYEWSGTIKIKCSAKDWNPIDIAQCEALQLFLQNHVPSHNGNCGGCKNKELMGTIRVPNIETGDIEVKGTFPFVGQVDCLCKLKTKDIVVSLYKGCRSDNTAKM